MQVKICLYLNIMDYVKLLRKILISGRGVSGKKEELIMSGKYPNIYNFIFSIYPDSTSIRETFKRLELGLHEKPKCPICGKPVEFIGKKNLMFRKYCSNSCRGKDPVNYMKWVEGQYKYNLEHYGVRHNFQVKSIIEKTHQTNLEKYGSEIPMQNTAIKNKVYNTKMKNHTFSTSEQENIFYKLLLEYYNKDDVVRQYKENRYPYRCDFYIKSLDLFIELQFHWSHGRRPYTGIQVDLDKLKIWGQYGKTKRQYRDAIVTWTERDVRKRNTAKQNNLNFLEFFDIYEAKEFIRQYNKETSMG